MKFAFNNGKPGKDWFEKFKRRHPDLSIRKPEKLTTTRARMVNPVVLHRYFTGLNELLTETDISNKQSVIWNCDETGKQFEHFPVKILVPKGAISLVERTTANKIYF